MKLYCSPASAFSRKVRLLAATVGAADRIEIVSVNPVRDHAVLRPLNPLAKIPVLLIDDGTPIHDSPVICRYLADRFRAAAAVTTDPALRLDVEIGEALADGVIEAGMAYRAELTRPEAAQDAALLERLKARIDAGLDQLDARAIVAPDAWNLASMAAVAALGWLRFRLDGHFDLEARPALKAFFETANARPGVAETAPA